jgi:hypothetical protein
MNILDENFRIGSLDCPVAIPPYLTLEILSTMQPGVRADEQEVSVPELTD